MNTEAFAERAQKKNPRPSWNLNPRQFYSHNQGWWWKFRGLMLFTVGTHESLWGSLTVVAHWCSLKHNGIWGWSSYGKVMYCFLLEDMLQKPVVFRGVPLQVLAWPWVTVPLNSQPLAYYMKGQDHSPPKACFEWKPSSWLAIHIAMSI